MKLTIAWIGKTKEPAVQQLTEKYLKLLGHFIEVETLTLKEESKLLKQRSGARHYLVVLDSKGKEVSSETLAEFLKRRQEAAVPVLIAIGPADGFSHQVLQSADFVLSLGKMTLQHELARIMLLEQLYRAFTILKGHPYHSGH